MFNEWWKNSWFVAQVEFVEAKIIQPITILLLKFLQGFFCAYIAQLNKWYKEHNAINHVDLFDGHNFISNDNDTIIDAYSIEIKKDN